MSNIINFPRRRQQKPQTQSTAAKDINDWPVDTTVRDISAIKMREPVTVKPSDALEASLDNYRSTMLELAHRRKAFELQMTLEQNTAQIKLEAAGYKALVAGVPESDIYALGEDMAEALSSAMDTVAGA